jgi:hypothetical protein
MVMTTVFCAMLVINTLSLSLVTNHLATLQSEIFFMTEIVAFALTKKFKILLKP